MIGGSVNSNGIAGLVPFTTYTIQVAGVGVDGSTGVFSDPSSITTPEERKHMQSVVFFATVSKFAVIMTTAPGPPTNVEVMIIDDSLIEVRWSPPQMPNGIITGEEVWPSS